MDKKNISILAIGIVMYSIGFFCLNLIGKISMMIGGILLSVLFVRIGLKIRSRRKVLGNILCILGVALAILITVNLAIVIIISEARFR